jgi:hypothetical protein
MQSQHRAGATVLGGFAHEGPIAMESMVGCDGASETFGQHNDPAEPTLGYVAPMGIQITTADGVYLGQVTATWPRYVFVESSPGSTEGYWVPTEAFAGTEDGVLVLNVTWADVDRLGWTERPPAGPESPG